MLFLVISTIPNLTLLSYPVTYQDHALPLVIYTSVLIVDWASDSEVKIFFWTLNLPSPLILTKLGYKISKFWQAWVLTGTVT